LTDKEEDLSLSDSQQRVAEALVFSGVNYERERLIRLLEPHRGKAINVDTMLDIINNIPPKVDDAEQE
jgi:hypothetical protein